VQGVAGGALSGPSGIGTTTNNELDETT